MKPRLKYADVFKPLDLEALEWEKTKLLFDGELVTYAGHHPGTLIWLKNKSGHVTPYLQADVISRLRIA